MSEETYVPGKAYNEGWQDRYSGKLERSWNSMGGSRSPYWEEYQQGYADASKEIIDNARTAVKKNTNEGKSESQTFLFG